jgi:uncharacterized protein DUF5522
MSPTKPPPLVEGVDFYLEDGNCVFTAEYHLKRGYCCNSKCRHCPYGETPILSPGITIVGLPRGGSSGR